MVSRSFRGALLAVALGRAGAAPGASAPAEQLARELAALRQLPASPARLGEASRLLFLQAGRAAGRAEQNELHRRGRLFAERALRANPDEPSALLWWAAHRGAMATVLNPFEAMKIADEVEQKLLHLRSVAPAYDHAAADRVLGRLYQLAPSIVSIGSMDKAGLHLEAALARDAAFPGNQLFYAQYLREKGDCAGARTWAGRMLESPELANHPFEADDWRAEAGALLRGAERDCPAARKGSD